MPLKSLLFLKRVSFFSLLLLVAFQFISSSTRAQLRQVYLNNIDQSHIHSLSFYSPSSGYASFHEWIAFTADSGRSFSQKQIRTQNVDFNGFPLSFMTGFLANGVKAFDQQTLLVYGYWYFDNVILRSTDGGNTFKVVYHRPYDSRYWDEGIKDMSFLQNGQTGYAIDEKYLLKTTDAGQSWIVLRQNGVLETPNHVQAIDANNIFIFTTHPHEQGLSDIMFRTANGGSNWQPVTLPVGELKSVYFLTASKGWANIDEAIYQTTNGGTTWTRQNHAAIPVKSSKLVFTDDQTGYYIGIDNMDVHKTTDAGKIWEPLPRDNNYSHWHGLRDLYFYNNTQFWAGGGQGYLALTTNAGGVPLPRAIFTKDTTGYSTTGKVQLTNHSKTGYSHRWFKNDTLIGTTYHASYNRTAYPLRDTIMLVVSNGVRSDTAIQYQEFFEPAYITSFSPAAAKSGTTVTINGYRLGSATAVYFGGVPATSFVVEDANTIKAVVGNGNSGSISVVVTYRGTATLPGFTFYPAPAITAFSPLAASAGTTLTVTGANFQDITAIRVAGIPVTNYTIVSPTTLTLVVPSSRSGAIEITTRGGIAQLPGFTAVPAITTFAPAIGTEGTILRIRGTSLQEVTGVTIGGLPAIAFTIHSVDSMTATVGLGATGSIVVSTTANTAAKPGFTFVNPPAITAVNPLSGPVGTTVTITGSNFKPVPADNIVLFGTLRAAVTAATASTLTVTVPAGATLHNISVTVNGLTAFSNKPFHTTFTGGAAITTASFNRQAVTTENAGVYRIYQEKAVADIDGDGKEDLYITDNNMGAMADILQNTTTGQNFTFNAHLRAGESAQSFMLADVDGDGKPELIKTGGQYIQIYRNTSSPGNFTFSEYDNRLYIWMPDTRRFHNIALKDIDKDGKTDIIVASLQNIYIFRNNGDPGYLAFEPVPLTSGGYDMTVDDVDLDGKPDIIQFNPATNSISIHKNTSTKGQVAFAAPVTLTAASPYTVTTGDIDGDGLPDIIAGSESAKKVEVFRNTTSGSNIAFANASSYAMSGIAYDAALADLNGDGKLDIVASTDQYHFVSFTNASTSGHVNFETAVNHLPGSYTGWDYRFRIAVADLNRDGRPDPMILDNNFSARLNLYINEAIAKPFIREFTPTMAGQGAVVTIKGKHFTGTTAVAFGGVAAASFTILSDTAIEATLGTGTSGNVSVTNTYGTTQIDGFVFGAIPRIVSFSPSKGPVGTKITLTGSGFDPVPANNTVFFGGVKTAVLTASPTALTLLVPAGASPDWITVTTHGRTAWSSKHFIVTFPGKTTGFSDSSFVANGDVAPGTISAIADLDGDGKNDLICMSNTTGLLIARNTSTRGNVSLEAAIPLTMDKPAVDVTVADFDGDGRIDIAAVAGTSSPYEPTLNSYLIFRNTTSGNAISFAPPLTYKIAEFPFPGNSIAAGDLDGDGRPEIIASITNNGIFTVRKNLSYPGQIAFDEAQQYWTNPSTHALTCDDIDGDGKAEVMISSEDSYYYGAVILFKNTASTGITLQQVPGIPTGGKPSVSFGDMDGDGKTDVLATSEMGRVISVARNVSTSNNPGYNSKSIEIFETPFTMRSCGLADLDGDGKPDMIIGASIHGGTPTIIYKNVSAPGTITWESRVLFTQFPASSFFVDMDGDGVVDIVEGRTYLNKMAREADIELCQDSDTLLVAGFTSRAYQWQQDAGNGFANIQDDNHFQGSASAALQLTNVPASWNGRKYRCIDQAQLPGRTYQLNIRQAGSVPVVQITTDKDSICTGSEISFTAKVENGGNAPSYQWQVNGNNIGQNTATFGSRELKDGDEVKVRMTSNAGCVSTATAMSNTIRVNVKDVLHTAVTIRATPDTGCTSDFITFTAYPVNGGLQPFFTWIMNDQGFGEGTTIQVPAGYPGLRIKAMMTTSLGCASEYRVYSTNELTIGGEGPGDPPTVLTPAVAIKASATQVCLGDEITFTATPQYGGNTPGYQWQVNGLPAGQNNPVFTANNLKPGDIIRVIMTSSAPCAINPMATSNAITLTSGPLVTPSVTITTQDNGACAGAEVTFTATPSHGGTAPAYQWKVNGIAVGINSQVFKTTTLNNGDKVTVTLYSNASCVTRDTAVSDTLSMTITPMVTPEITIAASATEICAGTKVYFTATTVYGGTIPQILWSDGTRGPTNSSSFLADGHNVSAILVSNLNCKTALYAESNVITMKVKPSFKPDVSLAASASEICPGTPVTFTATPVHGGPSPVYEWLVNDAFVTGVTTATYTDANLKNGDKVQVYMQSIAECVDYTMAYSNTISMNVANSSTASVAIEASATSICSGANITFTATPTNGGATPAYQWQVNGINVGQNAPTFNSSTLANNDQVKAILTSNAYCVANATSTSNVIPVTVKALALPAVIIAGNTTVDENSSAVLVATPQHGGTAPAYQWQDSTSLHGWQDIQGGVNVSLNYGAQQTGDAVRCRLTSNAECTQATTVLSAAVRFTLNGFTGGRIAPNPVEGTLYLDQLQLRDQWETLEIAPVSGGNKLMVRNITNQTSVAIPVHQLPKGLYVVLLTSKTGARKHIKFLKQ